MHHGRKGHTMEDTESSPRYIVNQTIMWETGYQMSYFLY